MPLGCPGRIDQQAVFFRRPQTQASPDALIEEHLGLGGPCQHHTINTRLIKAFCEHGTAHQGLQPASPDLVVDRLALVRGGLADDRGSRKPSSAKGMLNGKVFHMCWPLSDGSSKF